MTMSPQKIFDKVAKHLFAQGHRAIRAYGGSETQPMNVQCLYRAPNGDKCAVGALIPDDMYNAAYEGRSVSSLIESMQRAPSVTRLPSWFEKNQMLLGSLQNVHDVESCWADTATLKLKLRNVAEQFGLNADVLNGLELPTAGTTESKQ